MEAYKNIQKETVWTFVSLAEYIDGNADHVLVLVHTAQQTAKQEGRGAIR